MFWQALLVLPALAYIRDRTISRILLAVTGLFLLLLNTAGVVSFQPYQVFAVVLSLILLANPGDNSALLSLGTLISVMPLPQTLILALLALLIFVALSLGKEHGRFGTYLLAVIPMTALLTQLQHPLPGFILALFLVGLSPPGVWLTASYSRFPSLALLSSFVALMYLNTYRVAYTWFAPALLLFGATMMLVGVFNGAICESMPEAHSVLHQIVLGLLLLSASTNELAPLFNYLLLPSALSLSIVYQIHGYLCGAVRKDRILEFGGLSSKLKLEGAYTFTTYIILFALLSVGAEALMYAALHVDVGFLLAGCVALFVSAGSLAVFFRFYTLVYEGLPKIDIPSSRVQELVVTVLLASNFSVAVLAAFSSNLLSLMNIVGRAPALGVENVLLVIMSVGGVLSIIVAKCIKVVKTELWSTGYTSTEELSKQRGEVFTLWKEIFKPLYGIRVPDQAFSRVVGKLHPIILLVILIFAAYFVR